ncbi:MAG: AIR synthase family protein [Ignisphaera sp.]
MPNMSAKLPPNMLLKYIFSRVGSRDPSVIVGPSIGEDAAIIDIGGGRVLAVHADPITGAVEHIGWLSVHIACNDIAVRGARPKWLVPVILLPQSAGDKLVDEISRQMDEAANEVGAMIVGGHTEFTLGLSRPIISVTAIGVADKSRIVVTSGARVGDAVIMTKTVGVEGTAILSTDFRDVLRGLGVSEDVLKRGREFIKKVSIVKEALALAEAGLATSMHDPTEGGLVGGLAEIAYASRKTIEIWEDRVPIAAETRIIASALKIDPLKLIGSGSLVATIPEDRVSKAIEILRALGVEATVIGRVLDASDSYVVIHKRGGGIEKVTDVYIRDEIYTVWERLQGK